MATPLDTVDWNQLFRLLWVKRWFILTFVAIIILVSVIHVWRLPDIYTASTTILVESNMQSPVAYEEMLIPNSTENVYFETQIAILKSNMLLADTANQLELSAHYRQRNRGIRTIGQTVRTLRRNLHVRLLRGSRIIEIKVDDTSPEMAARIANQLVENYMKESYRARLFVSDQLLKWFPEQAEALKKNSPMAQLRKLESENVNDSLPSVMRDPVLTMIKQERVTLDAQIRELSSRYTAEHPMMKELTSRAQFLDSEMKVQTAKIVAGLKASLAGQFNVTNMKVVDVAEPPKAPSGPMRGLILFITTIVSFTVSGLLTIFLDKLDQNIRTEEDMRLIQGLPFLGYVPLIPALKSQTEEFRGFVGVVKDDQRLWDSIASVRTSVLFSMPAERSKTIMVTSSVPDEGKTTVACLLAISLSELGERVLLIDSDLRKPAIHQTFGIRNETGFTNCLIGAVKMHEVIRRVEGLPNVSIVTAGTIPPNPAALLNSSAIYQIIHEIQDDYDRIIFDAPPSFYIPDGIILSQRVHGTIIVCGNGMVHQNVAKKLLEKFSLAGGNVVGGVINLVEFNKLSDGYGYYYYYRKYHKYYSQPAEAKLLNSAAT